jgi:hypothetical protein
MSHKPRRPDQRSEPGPATQFRRALLLAIALGGAFGCSAYSTYKTVPLDCTVVNGYQFKTIDAFDTPGSAPLWTSADCTTGSVMAVSEVALTDGPVCGNTAALEIQASDNDQWGSLTGYNNFGPRDASAYQGISFWARSPGDTTKGFTILLDDPNTNTDTGVTPPIGNCTVYPTVDAGACGSTSGPATIVDPGTGAILSSGTLTAPPLPNACGNGYTTVELVTGNWSFYTIPFGAFQQIKDPNLVPNVDLPETGSAPGTSLITSALLDLTFRMQKAAIMNLQISNLAFYRAKGWVPSGADGGVDASQK